MAVDSIKKGELPYSFEAVDLVDVIKKSISEFSFACPLHTVIFKNKTKKQDASVVGDTSKLVQVFTNILNNAGKFTSPKKHIYRSCAKRIDVCHKNSR